MMKRIVSIQDISCFGKCSLTVALPIISAMGIETSVIPTAVLSTHTGGFKDYTFHDLTGDIPDISAHWKNLGLRFDAVYTGYLGSKEQIRIISDFFDDFKAEDNLIILDPVMGDGGNFYAGFTNDFISDMRKLCAKADFILPNMTEACLLLGVPYVERCGEEYVKDILVKLSGLGCRIPILTGIHCGSDRQGAAAYDSETGEFYFALNRNIDQVFHGTGDIFASVFTGAVTLGKSVGEALELSVNFTLDCILETLPCMEEMWYSTRFEPCLGKLIGYLN